MNIPFGKLLVLIGTVIIVPLIAGLYGILHDQLTYSISAEYYTLFKFVQFRCYETGNHLPFPPRICVAYVGFMATWWTGLFIGPVLGMTGLVHKTPRVMLAANAKAVMITLIVTLISGLTGLFYGWLVLADRGVDWSLPAGLTDERHFIMVGSMHNFGYRGGVIGMTAGILYHFRIKMKQL